VTCCGGRQHAWDQFHVEECWTPTKLRCFVVGENPGGLDSAYFYGSTRAVPVRRILLRELHSRGQISAPDLPSFRSAGFLFDHAARCHLSDAEIKAERRLAPRYASSRCAAAGHLPPLIARAATVWVMGYIARNAVAACCIEFPRDKRKISREPYPGQVHEARRFFVSRYVTRAPRTQVAIIFDRLDSLLDATTGSTLHQPAVPATRHLASDSQRRDQAQNHG
jgi:hypothetical protein